MSDNDENSNNDDYDEYNYLGPENQEDDLTNNDANPENNTECELESKQLQNDNINGNNFHM